MAQTNIRGGQIADGSTGVSLTVDVTGTLPMGNGGTGLTASGTAGNVLYSSGGVWTSTALTKSDVGLGSVDNTSDATKNSAAVALTNKTLDGTANTVLNVTGMGLPVQAATTGSETYTIASGSVTQINGTGIDSRTMAVGERILVWHAPATSGAGTAFNRTLLPTNGVYVVTNATTNLTVSRAADASGSVSPAGLSYFCEAGTNWGASYLSATDPQNLSTFTWGTTNLRYNVVVGPNPHFTQMFCNTGVITGGGFNATLQGNGSMAGAITLTLPITTDTIVGRATADTLTNKTLTSPTINGYTEGVVAIGTVTTTSTLSLASGTVLTATLTASTACTFTMPTATAGKSFVLLLNQAATTGNGSATFTGVRWNSGGAPTITVTAAKMDILTFVADGTSWYGSYSQGY